MPWFVMSNLNVCSECYGVITEPICADCVGKEIKAWLDEQKIGRVQQNILNRKVFSLIKKANWLDFSNVNCIMCLNPVHKLCSYCLMRKARRAIGNSISEGAEVVFNYEIYEHGLHRGVV